MSAYTPGYPTKLDHAARNAVPGPYHAVARGDDRDVLTIEKAMLVGVNPNDSVTLKAEAVDALERILAAYKSDLHVSGAADRVVTNAATVEAAVMALNRVRG